MELTQIGTIHSPYKNKEEAPKQGKFKNSINEIEIYQEYKVALNKIKNLSHLIVLYWGNQANRETTETTPPWTSEKYGVFSTRSPNRPNPITFCVVELVELQDTTLKVKNLDTLDQSPLLDIKAYDPKIDCYSNAQRKKKEDY